MKFCPTVFCVKFISAECLVCRMHCAMQFSIPRSVTDQTCALTRKFCCTLTYRKPTHPLESVTQLQSAADGDGVPLKLISVKICYFIEPIDVEVACVFVRDYCFFFWIPFIVRHSKEHNVPETGSVSVLGWGVGDVYSVGFVRKSQLQSLDVAPIPPDQAMSLVELS
jgi:hypothetical protein